MWIPRLLEKELQRKALARPLLIVCGARRVGKTALAQRVFPRHAFVSLDSPEHAKTAQEDPAHFLREHSAPLIVDAIHKAPELLRFLHDRVGRERVPMGSYVVTASGLHSALQEVAGASPGQVALFCLGGLCALELQGAGLAPAPASLILRGGFPELVTQPKRSPEEFFQTYLKTYVDELVDVNRLLTKVRNAFEDLLPMLARVSAEPINRTTLAKPLNRRPPSINRWVLYLEDDGVLGLLPGWTSPIRFLVKSPKVYFRDTALACHLLGLRSEEEILASPHMEALWQTRVYNEIRDQLEAGIGGGELLFWKDRTKGADFVLKREAKLQLALTLWQTNPQVPSLLERVRLLFTPHPPLTLFSPVDKRERLSDHASAMSLEGVSDWLRGKPL